MGSVQLQGGVRLDTGKAWLRKWRQKGWMSVLGAFRQREMATGHVSQGRASFASEEYGSSEGRMGWADGGRKEALREREDSLVFF